MSRSPLENQYAPLGDYLIEQAAAGQRQVVLPFAQIEVAILGHPLPRSARSWLSWWQGTGRHAPRLDVRSPALAYGAMQRA